MAEDIYRELQRHLDRMPVGFPAAESGVEIRILKHLFTQHDAEIALLLSAIPEPLRVIHKRVDGLMSADDLRLALNDMDSRGLIQRLSKPAGALYGKLPFVVGIYERQVNRLTEEFERDCRQYFEEAFHGAMLTLRTSQMRTVPLNLTIEPEHGIAPYDDIREAVLRSEGPFAVLHCICRRGRDLVGEPCKTTSLRENCLMLGRAATAMVDAGLARFIACEEMLALLDRAGEEGLVIEPQNTRDPLFICCCCPCCCAVLTTARRLPRPAEFFRTNYYAAVAESECQACGTCLERCPVEALAMDNGTARADRTRCIGCGLCVIACPSGAVALHKKEHETVPPEDTRALYKQMFLERYGTLGTAGALARNLLGLKF